MWVQAIDLKTFLGVFTNKQSKPKPVGLLQYCEMPTSALNHHYAVYVQVCELDIIFNFEKAYYMLDELLIAGEIQETSKKNVLKAIAAQDMLQEVRSHIHPCLYIIELSPVTKSSTPLRP